MDALSYLLGLEVIDSLRRDARRTPVIAEPEFKPFVFPSEVSPAPQVSAAAPATLLELGVPSALAGELEAALRFVGATRGDRITGFTFRTPDGVSHALRQNGSSERAPRRAA
jgi:hypothetical protein